MSKKKDPSALRAPSLSGTADPPNGGADTAPKEETVPRIYAGASLPGMRHGTAILGTLPRVIDDNNLRELCVPVQDFGAFERRRKDITSRESMLYKRSEAVAAEMARR